MRIALRESTLEWWSIFQNVVFVLVFLYFFTTSADLLNLEVSVFRCKLNHAIALTLFAVLIFSKKPWRFDKRLFLAFALTAVSMAISAFFSPMVYRSIGYLMVYLFTFVVYFILPYNLVLMYGREMIFKIYKLAFIATGIFAALQFFVSFFGVVAPFVGQTVARKYSRGQAMAYEPSYFALYMIAYVMYCNAFYLFDSEKMFELRRLIKLLFVNLLLLVSTSTGAFFAYFILFAVCFGLEGMKWVRACKRGITKKLLWFAALSSLFFAGIAIIARDIFIDSFWKFFRAGFRFHGSFVERWEGIVRAWRVFVEHPWVGVGVGGAGPLLYQWHFFRREGVELYQPPIDIFEYFDPTNVLTELLASLGIMGAVAFGIFFFYYFRNFCGINKLSSLPVKEKGNIYALVVSVLVMLVALQFNQNMFRSYVWIHLAFSLAYLISLKNQYARS